MFKSRHVPVMLNEVIDALQVKKGGKYIDCNLGGGGHTSKILEAGGIVAGIDWDKEAVAHTSELLSDYIKKGQLKIFNMSMSQIDKIPEAMGWKSSEVSGVLYDLGLSTFQLRDENKGFSFEDESELDMRMSDDIAVKASDLVKALSVSELERIIKEYGEDPQAKRFAKAIKDLVSSSNGNFTAKQMAEAIRKSSIYPQSRVHPATRVFQALRIVVNSELENVKESLEKSVSLLEQDGRLVILTFHSLEDRIAKDIGLNANLRSLTSEPVQPSLEEVEKNSPSRSAKLRIYEKLN